MPKSLERSPGVHAYIFQNHPDYGKERHLKIKWIAHARVDNITPSLLKLMKEAGCILLRFGIESGSRRIIDILKKRDSDIDWIETSRAVFKNSREEGISTAALFIIGSPSESQSEIESSLKLAKELEPDFIQVHFFTPYVGSAAYEQYKSRIEGESLL